jgi:hypothetical protein
MHEQVPDPRAQCTGQTNTLQPEGAVRRTYSLQCAVLLHDVRAVRGGAALCCLPQRTQCEHFSLALGSCDVPTRRAVQLAEMTHYSCRAKLGDWDLMILVALFVVPKGVGRQGIKRKLNIVDSE